MIRSGDYEVYRVMVPEQEVWIRVYTAIFRFGYTGKRIVWLGKHNMYTQGRSEVSVSPTVFGEIQKHVAGIVKDRFRNNEPDEVIDMPSPLEVTDLPGGRHKPDDPDNRPAKNEAPRRNPNRTRNARLPQKAQKTGVRTGNDRPATFHQLRLQFCI